MDQCQVTVSGFITGELFKLGVFYVFGYQGANISYLIDAVSNHPGLNYVQTYHEQGAAFAANGYAQASQVLGVAIASSGPGALNLVTGIANAYCDSIPTLFICGDLSHRYQKNTLPLRQDGFQSTDIVSIVRPITKYAELVRSPDDIRRCFERAIFEATNGRRGPVLLSIPHWIQRAEIAPATLKGFVAEPPEREQDAESISWEVLDFLSRSRRPLILLGGGCANPETISTLMRFLERNPLPVVVSLCGLSVISHDHPSYIGFIGDYGHRHANLALAASDCLIVLGSRMDERQVGFLKDFRENKTIVHVDIDPSELRCRSDHYLPEKGRVDDFLNGLAPVCLDQASLSEWKSDLRQLKKKYPVCMSSDKLSPAPFLSELFGRLAANAQVYVDVGLHQMCTAQSGVLTNGKKLYFSGGLGSMGYALPASIGGHLAEPGRQTLCIAGDGGLMMSLPELQTITRDRLDVKIIVLNNHCLGMVRNYQMAALGGRTVGTVDGYLAGDLNKIAHAFDLKFFRIEKQGDVEMMGEILRNEGPVLVEVVFPDDLMPSPASVNYPLHDDVLFLQGLTNEAK
ncbi:MAG: thiamine pyrophosphate-binding protein [Negativicutes bacterium]|nr:thiamine pyrophosphate-binding protein [Negativicutes bacterium]